MSGDYSWLTWIIIGFLAGGLAKLVMPGKDPGGCVITILLGIGGAMLAGFLGRTLGLYEASGGSNLFLDILAAAVGAVLILFLYRLILKRR